MPPDFEQIIQINESDELVDTNLDLNTGDRIVFTSDGTIWAGVWFTGRNGPDGWTWRAHDPKFPLRNGTVYSLIGVLDGKYFAIGRGFERTYTGRASRLYLRINDDTPGNGDGAFTCNIQVYRTADTPQPTGELFPGIPGQPI